MAVGRLDSNGPQTLRVLLIDDDADDRQLISESVESDDGTIVCDVVDSYQSGESAILGGSYDAYLVDFRLGAESGIDLIRELGERAGGPMILLTGAGGSIIDDEALAAGAADYFEKGHLTTAGIRRSIRYAIRMWNERSRYQSLFDGVPVGLIRTDPEGSLIEANTAAVEMLGHRDRSQLVGLHLFDLFAEPEGLIEASASALTNPVTVTNVELSRADNTSLWVDVMLHPVLSTGGAISWIEWVMTEVTERRAAIRESDFRSELLDRVGSAVIVADNAGICTFWNRHAEIMYGWKTTEAVGRPITDLTVVQGDEGLAAEILAQIAATGRWEGEFTVRRKDGSSFLARVSNALLTDDDGAPAGVVGVSLDVTATREVEAELKRSQVLITAAFESSPIGKVITSLPDRTIVSCNPAYAALLGVPIIDLIGRSIREFTHPGDLDLTNDPDRILTERRFIRSDGEVVWVRLHSSPIHQDDRPGDYELGQLVDITAAKHAEDQIRFQASLLDQVQHAVTATDMTGAITYWNRRAETLFGWTRSEVMGRDNIGVISPDAPPEFMAGLESDFPGDGTWEGETILTRKDGSTFPAWSSYTLIRDIDGDPVGAVGVNVDLTDIRQAEQRARSQAALSQTLLESVSVPIAIIDQDGHLVVSNPSWELTVPTGPGHDGYLPPGVADHDTALLTEVTNGVADVLHGRTDRFVIEYASDRTAEPRWFRTLVARAESGAVISHWDITAERIATATLEATIKVKDAFIASVSHELRTPLTAVLGLSETLHSGLVPTEEAEEVVALIASQAQDIALIVEDLLMAGRLESDTLSIQPTTVDMAVEMSKVIQPRLYTKVIEIDVTFAEGMVIALADPLRVRQVLRNLITNAFRYGRPPITVSGSVRDGKCLIEVIDHGDGIPQSAEIRMFEPYATFGPIDGQPLSIGLGLHVSRRLVRMMGGDLTYHRQDGRTVFAMTLPTSE